LFTLTLESVFQMSCFVTMEGVFFAICFSLLSVNFLLKICILNIRNSIFIGKTLFIVVTFLLASYHLIILIYTCSIFVLLTKFSYGEAIEDW
jgi:hypothetical protein